MEENKLIKVVIKKGETFKLNGEQVVVTDVFPNHVGFYYKKENGEEEFCNTMFSELNFEPVYE